MSRSTRTRNPRGEGERLREGLMESARELLLELGDQDKLSVRAVTARAGVTPNALYLHFANKDELLSAVMIAGYTELREFLAAATRAGEDSVHRLRAFCAAYLQFAAERPGIYRVLFMTKIREGVPVPTPEGPVGEDEGVDTFDDLRRLVGDCLSEGSDPFVQSTHLWAGLHGYVALRLVLPAFAWEPDPDYVEAMIRLHVLDVSSEDR